MNLEKIKGVISEYADKTGKKLFDVVYHKNDATLSVTFDEQLSLDELESISNEVSGLLDQYDDEFEDNYFLDVSTVGAERPIRNEEELIGALNNYIYVKEGKNEYYGDLVGYDNGIIKLEVKDKTRTKTVEVNYKDVKQVRYAVRL